jgi:hypothetical protein
MLPFVQNKIERSQLFWVAATREAAGTARTADLVLVRQRRPFHPVHQVLDFAWSYINSGDLLSLKAQPVLEGGS